MDEEISVWANAILDNGEYCWQECCETEMCQKCSRLNNGYTDYFDDTFTFIGETTL